MKKLKKTTALLLASAVLSIAFQYTAELFADEAGSYLENTAFNAPFEIMSTSVAKDGGTIAIIIEDANKKVLALCLDGRIGVAEHGKYLYLNAEYPSDASAKKVAACSETENKVVNILKTAKIDGNNQRAKQDKVQAIIDKAERRCSQAGVLQISGRWDTGFGGMTITQQGENVSGSYTHDKGKIEGKLDGLFLRGRWSESPTYAPPRDAGDFEFEFSPDGKTFSGQWRYGYNKEKWDDAWRGKKID